MAGFSSITAASEARCLVRQGSIHRATLRQSISKSALGLWEIAGMIMHMYTASLHVCNDGIDGSSKQKINHMTLEKCSFHPPMLSCAAMSHAVMCYSGQRTERIPKCQSLHAALCRNASAARVRRVRPTMSSTCLVTIGAGPGMASLAAPSATGFLQ